MRPPAQLVLQLCPDPLKQDPLSAKYIDRNAAMSIVEFWGQSPREHTNLKPAWRISRARSDS
jgi:hypothetical protein